MIARKNVAVRTDGRFPLLRWRLLAANLIIAGIIVGAWPGRGVGGEDNGQTRHPSFALGKEMRFTVDSYANVIAWSPDSRYLAASDQRGHNVYVWDVTTGKTVFKVPNSAGNTPGLAFTKDGQFLLGTVYVPPGNSFSVWNAHTGELIRNVPGPDPKQAPVGNSAAQIITVSPDGRHVLVTYGGNRYCGIYDAASWQLESVIQHDLDQIHGMAFSPNGQTIALGGYSGNVQLFRFADGQKLKTFRGDPNNPGHIYAVAFSPDGRVIATGSAVNDNTDDRQLRLWNAETYELVRAYSTGFKQNVHGISYTPDGRYLATVGYPSSIRIWDANSTQLVKETSTASFLFSRIAAVVAFSPDGRKLAYGGEGGVTVAEVDTRN